MPCTWCGTGQASSYHCNPKAGAPGLWPHCCSSLAAPASDLEEKAVLLAHHSGACHALQLSEGIHVFEPKHSILIQIYVNVWTFDGDLLPRTIFFSPHLSSLYSLKTVCVLIGSKRTGSFLMGPFLNCHCDFQATSDKEFKLLFFFLHKMKQTVCLLYTRRIQKNCILG